jgi:hypothetical protein
MRTVDLSKHYDHLSPRERVAMITSAEMRGDEVEVARLHATAPQSTWRVKEHIWYGDALTQLTMAYAIEQLDRLVCYHRAIAFLDDTERPRLEASSRVLAYHLVRASNGWDLFCTRLGFPAPGPLATLPVHQTIADGVALARHFAYSQVEMADWLAEQRITGALPTPESFAEGWQQALEKLA